MIDNPDRLVLSCCPDRMQPVRSGGIVQPAQHEVDVDFAIYIPDYICYAAIVPSPPAVSMPHGACATSTCRTHATQRFGHRNPLPCKEVRAKARRVAHRREKRCACAPLHQNNRLLCVGAARRTHHPWPCRRRGCLAGCARLAHRERRSTARLVHTISDCRFWIADCRAWRSNASWQSCRCGLLNANWYKRPTQEILCCKVWVIVECMATMAQQGLTLPTAYGERWQAVPR